MKGLVNSGFIPKNFGELVSDNEDKLIEAFGNNINLGSDSFIADFNDIYSYEVSKIWEALVFLWMAQYVATASGISLDFAADNKGLSRLQATATTVLAKLTVTNPTTLLQNSEASATGVDTIFRLTADILINNTACIASNVSVNTNTEIEYTINIDGTDYTYPPFILDDTPQIALGLRDLINTAAIGITATVFDGDQIAIISDTDSEFSITVSTGISIESVTNFGEFIASDKGSIYLPANTLINILTPTSGWISVINPLAGDTGRDRETDVEFRQRAKESDRINGTGTEAAITAGLRNLAGVTVVRVIENKEKITVDGIPASSFKTIVLGGDPDDIGNMIWLKKSLGIEAYGDIPVTVKDSEGFDQVVYFSRPVSIYIFVKVTITLDGTNSYPIDGDDVITQEILNTISSLTVSSDVIYQSFYKSVYSVSGIATALIEVGSSTTETPTPPLSSANIVIGSSEVAVSDSSKIEIDIV